LSSERTGGGGGKGRETEEGGEVREEGQVEEAGGWYKLATAHGQLHMTGNCITLSSFCECQGGTQRWRRGRGKRGRDCTGCSHKMRPLRPPQK